MSSRPRRSAAQKASVAITDMADRDNHNTMSPSRSRRAGDNKGLASVSRGGQDDKDHTYLTVKLPANKLRQATTTTNNNRTGSSISVSSDSAPKRPTRGNKKNYVVDDSDSDVEEEGEDEIQVGALAGNDGGDEEDESALSPDDDDEDADADEMDIVADGEEDDEDAEGEDEYEMSPAQAAPTIKISKPAKTSPSSKKSRQALPRKTAGQASSVRADNSDDDELSDLDSDDEAMNLDDEDAEGEDADEDMDAEGEEIEDDQDAEGEPDADATGGPVTADIDSDEDGSRGGTPDLSRMTQRQRARFEGLDESHYQALSNEVQAKKHFTIEEKAMRRAEMARRRRNLSEKRNEEVKQETINKLLKKQAGKTNRKNLAAIGENEFEDEEGKPNPIFIRWTSTVKGNAIAVPEDIMSGPTGRLFANTVRPASTPRAGPPKMVEVVEEVS